MHLGNDMGWLAGYWSECSVLAEITLLIVEVMLKVVGDVDCCWSWKGRLLLVLEKWIAAGVGRVDCRWTLEKVDCCWTLEEWIVAGRWKSRLLLELEM